MDNFLFFVFILPMFGFIFRYAIMLIVGMIKKKETEKMFQNTIVKGQEPTVDILMSCFNEGEHVFNTINSLLSMNYPYEKMRVLVVDDKSSDDSFIWINKAKEKHPNNVIAIANENNCGKALNIAKCVQLSNAQLVMCVDSDAMFDKNCLLHLVSGFIGDKVAAVGGKIGVLNVNTNYITRIQTMLYYFVFTFSKVAETSSKSVDCLSGCLVLVKRSCYLQVLDRVLKRTWLGLKPTDGEDRFLTNSLLLKGYHTLYNDKAQCWTKVPDTLTQLFNQQVRWRRGMLREWFNVLLHFNSYVKSFNIFSFIFTTLSHVIIMVIPIIVPILYFCAFKSNGFVETLIKAKLFFLGFSLVTGFVLSKLIKKQHPEQSLTSYIEYLFLPIWMMIDAIFITLLAICTLDYEGWGTRAPVKKIINKG